MTDSLSKPETPWPHRLAVVLVCATFALLVVGALVTTTDAGMAFRDWPTSDGYFMFLLPLKRWFGSWNAFIEHTHRVLASGVGLLTIALAIVLWKRERRRWMRGWGTWR